MGMNSEQRYVEEHNMGHVAWKRGAFYKLRIMMRTMEDVNECKIQQGFNSEKLKRNTIQKRLNQFESKLDSSICCRYFCHVSLELIYSFFSFKNSNSDSRT